jgi:D-alanyl-D-alanine carboxypeptidase (penicillin-binding protein 5/6)
MKKAGLQKHFLSPLPCFAFVLAFCFLFGSPAFAQAPLSPLVPADDPPDISSRAAVLIDGTTGALLFSLDGNRSIPPASLAKLMTIHLALNEIKAGRAQADELVNLPPESWSVNQSPRSSLMFLNSGQRVTLGELLLGMAVSSGNDAAAAAALRFAPSLEAFTALMNAEAGRLSLSSTVFAEPSGISAENKTTALDFARFCRLYLAEHPEAPGLLHSVREFAYPLAANTPDKKPPTIVQYNHNTLLDLEGVDGLKTGYINEAGYNIALSAKRSNTRLIAVILGAETEESRNGDGKALLDWGFANYKTMTLTIDLLPQVYIWKGKTRYGEVTAAENPQMTASKRRGLVIVMDVELKEDLEAPLPAAYEAGTLIISDEMGELRRIPLVLKESAERGGIWRRFFDSIRLFFKRRFSFS